MAQRVCEKAAISVLKLAEKNAKNILVVDL